MGHEMTPLSELPGDGHVAGPQATLRVTEY